MSDEYKIIKTVELSENANGQNIKDEFDKVNENFQRLAGASITRGQDGVTRTHTFKFDDAGKCANEKDFKTWLMTKLGFPEDEADDIIESIVGAFEDYPVAVTTTTKWYSNSSYEIYITDDGDVKEALPIIYSNGTGDKKSLTYLQFIYDGNKVLKLGDLNVVLQISEDGYWIVNGVTTSIKAQGEPGKDGKDGPGLDFGFVEVDSEQYPSKSIRESLETRLLVKIRDDHNYWSGGAYIHLDNFHELDYVRDNVNGAWIEWSKYSDDDKISWYNKYVKDDFDVVFEHNDQLIIGKGKVEKYYAGGDTNLPIIGMFCNNITIINKNFHELTRVADSNGDRVTWSTLLEKEQNKWYDDNKGRVFLTTNGEETYMGYINKIEPFKIYGMHLTESNIYSPGIGYNDVQGFFDDINYASTNPGTPKGLWLRQPNGGLGAVFFGNSGVNDNNANNLQIFAIDNYNKVCNSDSFDYIKKNDANVNVIGSLNIQGIYPQIKLGTILKIDNSSFIFGDSSNRVGMYTTSGERFLQVQGASGTTTITPSQVTTNNITTTVATIGSLRVNDSIRIVDKPTGSLYLSVGKNSFKFGDNTGASASRFEVNWNSENCILTIQNSAATTTITSSQITTTGAIIGSLNISNQIELGAIMRIDNGSFIFGDLNDDKNVPRISMHKYSEENWPEDTPTPPSIINNESFLQVHGSTYTTTITPSQVTTNKIVSDNIEIAKDLYIVINKNDNIYSGANNTLDYAHLLWCVLDKLKIINGTEIKEGHYINGYSDLIITQYGTRYYNKTSDNNGIEFTVNDNDSKCTIYRVYGKILFGKGDISIINDMIEIDDFITIVIKDNYKYLIAPFGMSCNLKDKKPTEITYRMSNIFTDSAYEILDSIIYDTSLSTSTHDVQRIKSFNMMNYKVKICYEIGRNITVTPGEE